MQDVAEKQAGTGLRPLLLRGLKVWVWLTDVFHPDEFQVTLFWAGVIGFAGALSSIGFRYLTAFAHMTLTGERTLRMVETFSHLPLWQRLLTPAAGALIAGLIITLGRRFNPKVATTDYMEAIVLGNGRISARLSLVKCASAMFTIASGGSIGREGPLVQLSSLVASLLGRIQKWSALRLRLLVGCGAAAGIASAYNAPIAGALFVAEIVLGSLAMDIFGPLVFASVIATLTTRGLIGGDPLYGIPPFKLNASWEIIPYLLLGFGAGTAAPVFLRLLNASEAIFRKLKLPIFARMMIGGLIVGALATLHPEVCGNGYSAVNAILHGQWLWQMLAVVLIFKVVATAATFGSGAVGGVFTPTLFVGASLGYLFGAGFHALFPGTALDPAASALVGMGAFLAGTTHAPVMAIMMIFELTLDYQIILPLMLACVIAYYTAARIEPRSIYSESVKRKGGGRFSARLVDVNVGDLMKRDPVAVEPTDGFEAIGQKFLANRFTYLYVADPDRRFLGAISLHDIKSSLQDPLLANVIIAADLMHEDFPTITVETPLSEALGIFARHSGERLPVVNNDSQKRLVGSLSKTDLMLALATASQTPSPGRKSALANGAYGSEK
ncbi:MAG: ClcB-like voltage-gated chloride channel protein [Chthoniobacterales bacterium]